MAPVIPCSIGNISLFPRTTTFTSRKVNQLTKCKISGKSTQSFPLSQSISIIFPKYKSGSIIHHQQRSRILVTIGTDVAVEEPNSVIEGEDTDKTSEVPPDSAETSEASLTGNESVTPTAQSKRPRPVRKSDMPPVKNDELIPGAAFTGKVRSVLPFGAFVDFGAFTDGLVHVSQMSDSFVKDVGSFVSIGQEVKVKLLEANFETGRISLTMREGDDINKLQQRKDAPSVGSSDKPRPARKNTGMSNQKRDEVQKSTKFFRGQVLDGTVKNLTRAGAFISLPEGEEGFLPTSEESEGYGNVMGSSSLLVGQEVNVRVLRITRGQVTLTMKRKEDMEDLNLKLNKGVVHVATNPFELAFRKNEAIAAFLEERESKQKSAEINGSLKSSKQIEGHVDPTETESNTPVVDLPSSIDNVQVNVYSELDKVTEDDDPEKTVSDSLQNAGSAIEIIQKDEVSPKTSTLANTGINVDPVTHVVKEESNETDTTNEAANEMSSSETVVSEEVVASVDDTLLSDNKVVTPLVENEMSSVAANVALNDASIIDEVKEDINITDSPGETVDQISSSESKVAEEVVVSDANDTLIEDKVEIQAPPVVENEMPSAVSKEDEKEATSIPEQNGSVTSDDQTNIPFSQGSTIKAATVSPALVKQLREETGAGMMDSKKALVETGGDIVKAQEFLRKKGLASAEKKASRATAEGRIGSYIHDNRIGVLVEANCETDFVSRGDIFKQLVDDLAMQVAACPQVQYLVTEDVPEEIVNKEREIEMQKEDLFKKPEQIRSKIIEGRIRKRLEEFALLEQLYIKNDKLVVKDWVNQTIATIGENIKVRRFIRYNLGEGLEKKSRDFAAEVAAQTAAKSPPEVSKDQSLVEAKETYEKPPTVAISAALVKQLREETGAGMMDCKKALTEMSGNLQKAQEYLRKKGLSTADKKSSRLAAEGRIASYIHDSRIGVLIEVNCETDFVARSEKFKELVDDLAMQVVACPQVQFVSVDEIPENIVSMERELEMQRVDLQSKPENIRQKIVEGRVSKRLGELALLEQPFIKDDSVLVKDLVKQSVAAIGENIKVRRFVRFTLGEPVEGENLAVEA